MININPSDFKMQKEDPENVYALFQLYCRYPQKSIEKFYEFITTPPSGTYDPKFLSLNQVKHYKNKYSWDNRRSAYQADKQNKVMELIQFEDVNATYDNFIKINKIIETGIAKTAELIDNINPSKTSPYQANQMVTALKGLSDIQYNKLNEGIKKIKLDANVESTTTLTLEEKLEKYKELFTEDENAKD